MLSRVFLFLLTLAPSRRAVKPAIVGGVVHEERLELARVLVAAADRIVVLTGAGISTDSGIPDFRGPQGVWTKDPSAEKRATLQHYVADPAVRRKAWQDRLTSPAWDARPNAGHRALVDLERSGRLDTLVTQNIDELHQRAGNDPALVVEVHGTIRRWTCLTCEATGPMEEALERVRAGEDDPACDAIGAGGSRCGGIVKSATISFGQSLVPEVIDRAHRAAERTDLLVTVGTTLGVYPVAGMVPIALAAGARLVVVNGEATAFDHVADVVLRGPIGDLLPRLVA